MHLLKRFAEWYLGVPRAGVGEGTAWNFRFDAPWMTSLPTWATLLLILAAVAYIVWIYLRDARTAPPLKRALLTGLRLAVVAVVVLLLSQVSLSVNRTSLPVVAVLIDHSASMSLKDYYRDENDRSEAARLAGKGSPEGMSRLDLARAILCRDDAAFLEEIETEHRLRIYRFAGAASLVHSQVSEGAGEMNALVAELTALESDGAQTRLGPAVRKVLDDLRGTPLAAIVILSDGVTSTIDADRLTKVVHLAVEKHVPIFTIGLGSVQPADDVQLYDVRVDEVAFVDDPIIISAKARSYGFKGKTLVVTLKDAQTSTVLAETTLTTGADGQSTPIELSYTSSEDGEFDFLLEVAPLPGETNRDNNSDTRHISIRRGRIKVLLVDSQPRYEFRALKQLLERETTVELQTILQEADVEFAAEDRTALNHFPVSREELLLYDVVIFGDVDLSQLGPGVLENLRAFVVDAGGGVMLIAGEAHNPHTYRDTPLYDMLPIELDGTEAPASNPIIESFRPQLSVEGRAAGKLFQFADTRRESIQIFNKLPELYWYFESSRLKPGARVFLEHPTRLTPQNRLPLIVMQQFGAGKVLYHATDELWRWRALGEDLYYGRYWNHAIRYLSRAKLLGRERTVELSVDRQVYQLGEPVDVRVRFFDKRMIPLDSDPVSVMVQRRGGAQTRIVLSRSIEKPATFAGQFHGSREGAYRLWLASPALKKNPPSENFRVELPMRELQNRRLDRAELEQTAKATRGRYYSLADISQLPGDLPRGEPIPIETSDPIRLWNRWELLLLLAALLLWEWVLRKRARLV